MVPGLRKHTGYLGKHNTEVDTPERQNHPRWLVYVSCRGRTPWVEVSLRVCEGLWGTWCSKEDLRDEKETTTGRRKLEVLGKQKGRAHMAGSWWLRGQRATRQIPWGLVVT